MRRLAVSISIAAALVFACSSFGTTNSTPPGNDAGSDAGTIEEAGEAAPPPFDAGPDGGPVPDELYLWFAADRDLVLSPTDGKVERWKNILNSASDATASGNARPVVVAGAINGRPAVRFDGVDDQLDFSFSINRNEVSIVVVVANDDDDPPTVNRGCIGW